MTLCFEAEGRYFKIVSESIEQRGNEIVIPSEALVEFITKEEFEEIERKNDSAITINAGYLEF